MHQRKCETKETKENQAVKHESDKKKEGPSKGPDEVKSGPRATSRNEMQNWCQTHHLLAVLVIFYYH